MRIIHFQLIRNHVAAIVMLTAVVLFTTLAGRSASAFCGDASGDGTLKSNDLLMTARSALGVLALDSAQKARADIAAYGGSAPDGAVMSNDLLLAARGALNAVGLSCAEPVNQSWAMAIPATGDISYAELRSVETTSDGGFVFVGSASKSATCWDFWARKTDANGNTVWEKFISSGGCNDDTAYASITTPDGGIVITGSTTYNGSSNELNVMTAKIDASGNTLWTKVYDDVSGRSATSKGVDAAADGSVFVTGYSTIPLQFHVEDFLVLKYDSSGNQLWAVKYDRSSQDDRGYGVRATDDGGCVVAGYTYIMETSDQDGLVVKLDSSGGTQWSRIVEGPTNDTSYAFDNRFYDIMKAGTGYIAAGTTIKLGGNYDFWLVSLTSAGSVSGSSLHDIGAYDTLYSIDGTTDGGIIAAGQTGDTNDYIHNVAALRFDSASALSWMKSIGGAQDDFALQARATTGGNVVFAGFSASYGNGPWAVKLTSAGLCSGPGCP